MSMKMESETGQRNEMTEGIENTSSPLQAQLSDD